MSLNVLPGDFDWTCFGKYGGRWDFDDITEEVADGPCGIDVPLRSETVMIL